MVYHYPYSFLAGYPFKSDVNLVFLNRFECDAERMGARVFGRHCWLGPERTDVPQNYSEIRRCVYAARKLEASYAWYHGIIVKRLCEQGLP